MVPVRLGKCRLPAAVTEANGLAYSRAGGGESRLLSRIKPHRDSPPLLFFSRKRTSFVEDFAGRCCSRGAA